MNKAQFLIVLVLVLLVLATGMVVWQWCLHGISEMEVQYTGYCFESDRIGEIFEEFKALDFGRRNLGTLVRQVEEVSGVKSASVSYIPGGTVRLNVVCEDPDFLLTVRESAGNPESLWEIKGGKLSGISGTYVDEREKYRYEMELSRVFLENILTFGLNSEFYQVLASIEALLDDKSLKISVKYDNNMSGNLGWLVVFLPSCNANVFVKEKVSSKRLVSALKLIDSRSHGSNSHQVFDLYDNALVRRS